MSDSWETHEKLVLHELQRLSEKVESVDSKCDKINTDLVMLKTKSKMWGAITGFIVTSVVSMIEIFYRHTT